MGQVPVKVHGLVKEGDYILPSGDNDGFGIAVSPENLKLDQYQKIVGIAWSASNTIQSNYVKVAVGLNANDVARYSMKFEKKIEEQAREIVELKARFNKMDEVLAKLDAGYKSTLGGNNNQAAGTASVAAADATGTAGPRTVTYFKLTEEQVLEGIVMAEAKLRDAGVDVDKHPFFLKLNSDSEYKKDYISKLLQSFDKEIRANMQINQEKGFAVTVD